MTGKIVWYSDVYGYGFIQSCGCVYRFRKRSWQDFEEPERGLKVTFDPEKNEKGLRAYKVRKEQTNG